MFCFRLSQAEHSVFALQGVLTFCICREGTGALSSAGRWPGMCQLQANLSLSLAVERCAWLSWLSQNCQSLFKVITQAINNQLASLGRVLLTYTTLFALSYSRSHMRN